MRKHIMKNNLKYKGYGGHGHQVRDVLHIDDLCQLLEIQIKKLIKLITLFLMSEEGQKMQFRYYN